MTKDAITVTGPRPLMKGGLWRFDRTATLTTGLKSDSRQGRASQPLSFKACLPDDAIEDMFRKAAAERSTMVTDGICRDMKLDIGKGRIRGTRSCIARASGGKTALDLSGSYDTRMMTINFLEETLHDGYQGVGGEDWDPARPISRRWRMRAVREKDCPSEREIRQIRPFELLNFIFTPALDPIDAVLE